MTELRGNGIKPDLGRKKVIYGYDGKKSYSYSKFEGIEFLHAYRELRDNALALLGDFELISKEELAGELLNFYEVNKGMDDILGYALLSLNLILEFKETNDLRYLNGCLKINDLLCNKIRLIKSRFIKRCLYTSLVLELEGVKKLSKEKGVDFG